MKVGKMKTPAVLLFLLLFLPLSTIAEPLVLDWDTAWDFALEKNETLAAARDEVVRADHRVGEAWAGALPTLEFSGVYQHYFLVPSIIFNLPAARNNYPETGQSMGPMRVKAQFGSENNFNAFLDLTQPLFVGGKVGIALKIAEHYRALTQLGVRVSEEDLRLNLARLFYGSILADRFLDVTREAYAQAQRHQEQTQNLYEQGVVSEYDFIRAKVAVANLRPQVQRAQAGRELSYKALKNLIGLDVDREITIEGDLEYRWEPPQSYKEATHLALQRRTEFRQLDLQKELYKGQYKIEERGWLWPNLLLGLRWETSAQENHTNFSKYEFLGGYGGSLILQIPLFDGFRARHRAQQALVSIRSAERQKAMLTRGVQIQVFQASSQYEEAEKELEAAEEALEQAEKGQHIAELRYSQGVGTQLEILDAQLQLNTSKVNVLQAKYNRLIARAQYDRAVGVDGTMQK